MATPIFTLIHSPLVGPYTWALVAEELRQRGYPVVVPELSSPAKASQPYWQLHAQAVVEALQEIPAELPLLLVAHSGAGPILPAIKMAMRNPVAGYIFADAGWPEDGKSRLDVVGDPLQVERFRRSMQGEFLPVWSDAELREVIPDDEIRRSFVCELRPLPLAVYVEPLPVFAGFPDAPCGYLRFGPNPAYDHSAWQALQHGCKQIRLEGTHFHMLVKPVEVAEALIQLVENQNTSH